MAGTSKEVLEFLKQNARLSGQELMRYFGTSLSVRSKPDESLVTEADLASEKLLVEAIKQRFPDDVICSEESGLSSADRSEGRHIWIIDPLDGTTNFANNYPFFCVSIARGVFLANGRIDIRWAAIEEPCRERTFLAAKGEGASVNGRALKVRAARELKDSFLVTGFYYATGEALRSEVDRFRKVAAICSSIRRDGAAALDLAYVAEGVFDGFWEAGLKPWDVAAGSLLVTEAGGRVANYDDPNDFNVEGQGLVSGSPHILKELFRFF